MERILSLRSQWFEVSLGKEPRGNNAHDLPVRKDN